MKNEQTTPVVKYFCTVEFLCKISFRRTSDVERRLKYRIDQSHLTSVTKISIPSAVVYYHCAWYTCFCNGCQQYFALLPFDQAHQSGLQPKFSGLCIRTNQNNLVASSINRNTISLNRNANAEQVEIIDFLTLEEDLFLR